MEANKILLQRKFARIIEQLAQEAQITEEQAIGLFYTSETYQLISQGIGDLHCYSDGYLVDELLLEHHLIEDKGYY